MNLLGHLQPNISIPGLNKTKPSIRTPQIRRERNNLGNNRSKYQIPTIYKRKNPLKPYFHPKTTKKHPPRYRQYDVIFYKTWKVINLFKIFLFQYLK